MVEFVTSERTEETEVYDVSFGNSVSFELDVVLPLMAGIGLSSGLRGDTPCESRVMS